MIASSKKLVWLDINASYSHSSLALPSIEACRKGDDFEWSSVGGTINSDVYLLTMELYAARPIIVAATLWLFNHEIVLKVCQRVKALLPDVIIILGGPETNGNNEEFLRRNPSINYLFRGEGEEEFHKFIGGVDPIEIEGLCYLNDSGEYIDNGTARVDDFAALPAPESSRFFSYSAPFVQIESSRGCFNNCAFCVSGGDKPVKVKPIGEIKTRIESIQKRGIKDIRVLDRTFNYSPTRATEMLNLFRQYPSMNFHLEIHPALLTDSLCELLESMPAGVLHLEAGMQSLDDKVIEACERVGSNRAALEGLTRLCKMSNFETHADLIAGLPHYTLDQIFSDVKELSRLNAGEIQLELLKLLPGTKMRREASKWAVKYAQSPPYEVLESASISIVELNTARLLSKLIDKFYNAKGWQAITRKLINEVDNFLELFLDYLTPMELLEKPLSLSKRGSLLYNFCLDELHGAYVDEISVAWIENGISLKGAEAGRVEKARTLPHSMERLPNVHYYIWRGSTKSYIFGFDRSKEHSRPTIKVEVDREITQ